MDCIIFSFTEMGDEEDSSGIMILIHLSGP